MVEPHSAPRDNREGAEDVSTRLLTLAYAVVDGFCSLAVAAGGGREGGLGGVAAWYSSSNVPLFNGAGLFSRRLVRPDTISAIEDYFMPRGYPYCLVTLDDLVPDSHALLRPFNYIEFDSSPAMWLDGPPAQLGDTGEDLWISRVQSRTELEAFKSVLSRVFGIGWAELDLIMGEKMLQAPRVRNYLGWVKGVPAVTATLVLSKGAAGVWNVGTHPGYRRRGLAAGMMRRLVADAQALGYSSTVLLSTPEGLPMYGRLGYRVMTRVRTFTHWNQG